MRMVKLEGWVIFDENELQHGKNMVAQIDHELFNVEGVMQWSLVETSNEEVEFNWDEEE